MQSDYWGSRKLERYADYTFWITGILLGALLGYTSRFYINGDAMTYVEMGEAIRTGWWGGLANLTYSLGYPAVLSVFQTVLDTNPMNEIQWLKVANFACLLCAMASCHKLVKIVLDERQNLEDPHHKLLPPLATKSLCYGMFLVCTLVLIRVRLINPDMLVCALIINAVIVILLIRRSPLIYKWYILLGLIIGIGYLVKSFFLIYSSILLLTAALCSASLKKAIARLATTFAVIAILSAPLMGVLSNKLGRFTYSRIGPLAYAQLVSGSGEPTRPTVIVVKPKTSLFPSATPETRPSAYDIAYWNEGLKPKFDIGTQLKTIIRNIGAIFSQSPWLFFVLILLAVMWSSGAIKVGPLLPPSVPIVLVLPALGGIGFYTLIYMEPRYVAPFLFLAFVSMVITVRIRVNNPASQKTFSLATGILMLLFAGILIQSTYDQSVRGLISTKRKLSYKAAFVEQTHVKSTIERLGVARGAHVGIICGMPTYWARIAGVRIIAEVNDCHEFLSVGKDNRAAVFSALKKEGIEALVAKGAEFGKLQDEGWSKVPETRDFYMSPIR